MVFCACATSAPNPEQPPASVPATSPASLYDRLGGLPAIHAVIEDMVANIAGDERINARFANADIPKLKQSLVDQVCQATGGPCVYKGKDMKTAHQHMNLTNADFDALVDDLQKSLNKFKVGALEQSQLLGALGPMRPQIVNNGAAAAASK